MMLVPACIMQRAVRSGGSPPPPGELSIVTDRHVKQTPAADQTIGDAPTRAGPPSSLGA